MSHPIAVLEFWLSDLGPEGWYAGGEEIDAEITARFGELWQAAYDGGLEHWLEAPAGALAYLVVTDQFSRNIHRGAAEAFATDPQARAAARLAVENDWDLEVPEPERQFFYLPFEHSEDLADQDLAVELIAARMPQTGAETLLHAKAHREIIRRFGRFPFRNAALSRQSSPEEEAFMNDGGYRVIVDQLREN